MPFQQSWRSNAMSITGWASSLWNLPSRSVMGGEAAASLAAGEAPCAAASLIEAAGAGGGAAAEGSGAGVGTGDTGTSDGGTFGMLRVAPLCFRIRLPGWLLPEPPPFPGNMDRSAFKDNARRHARTRVLQRKAPAAEAACRALRCGNCAPGAVLGGEMAIIRPEIRTYLSGWMGFIMGVRLERRLFLATTIRSTARFHGGAKLPDGLARRALALAPCQSARPWWLAQHRCHTSPHQAMQAKLVQNQACVMVMATRQRVLCEESVRLPATFHHFAGWQRRKRP